MNWKEVEAYLENDDRVIVPIGSTEQHGPYGLFGTDHMAAGLGMVIRLMSGMGLRVDGSFLGLFLYMLYFAVMINLVLAIFNMLPIPPLDGSKILFGVLPTKYEESYLRFEQYGPMILIGLVIMSSFLRIPIFSFWVMPFVSFFSDLFVGRDLINLF